jgi:hypothetical protein
MSVREPGPAYGARFRVSGVVCRVSGFGFRFSVFGFGVSGFGSAPCRPSAKARPRARYTTCFRVQGSGFIFVTLQMDRVALWRELLYEKSCFTKLLHGCGESGNYAPADLARNERQNHFCPSIFLVQIGPWTSESDVLGLNRFRYLIKLCGLVEGLIPASIYDKYSVYPSIRPICTRCCCTMTNMIQVCSNFR